MYAQRQKRVLEEYSEWQQMQGQKMQEGELQLFGIQNTYQYGVHQISSARIEQELKDGPPTGLSKAEKKIWKEKMSILRGIAKERESFLNPIQEVENIGKQKLEGQERLGNKTAADYAQSMQDVKILAQVDFQEQPLKNMQAEKPSIKYANVKKLHEILNNLQEYTASTITGQQLAGLAAQYNALKLTAKATSARQLEEAAAFASHEAGFALLLHCVVAALVDNMDQMPMNEINMDYFKKLCGLERVYSAAVLKLRKSDDYKEQSEAYQKELERKQLEGEEQRKREAEERLKARRTYLRTGIVQKNTPAQWPLGSYAHIIEQELGEWFLQPECRLEEVVEKVQKMESNFLQNRERMKKRVAEHPSLVFRIHKDQVLSLLEQEINKDRLYLMDEAAVHATVDRFVASIAQELERCRQRGDYLATLEELNYFVTLSPLPQAVEKLLLEQNSQGDFMAAASLLSQQVEYNLNVCQWILEEQLQCVSSAPILDWLKKNRSAILLEGSLAQVQGVAQHCQNEGELKEIFEKDKQLSRSMEKNQDAFESLIGEKRFSAAAWSQLFRWEEEHFTQEEKQFRKELTALMKDLTAANRETLCLREYLEGRQEAQEVQETQEETVQKEQQTQAGQTNQDQIEEKLFRWEGFSGALQGYENKMMKVLEKLLKEGKLNGQLEFLSPVTQLSDLNALSYVEFQTLVRHLRVNLGKSIRSWYALAKSDEVCIAMFEQMLTGELTDETLMAAAEKKEKELKAEAYTTSLRFRCALKNKGVHPWYPRKLEYRYMDNTDSTAVGKETRAERRINRFALPGAIWDVLRENGKMKEAIQAIHNAGEDAVKMRVSLLNMLEKERSKSKRANAVYERVDSMSNREFKDISYELRLCGQESVFLSKEYNPDGYKAFTGSERKEYTRVLKEIGDKVLNRMWQLESHLEKYAARADRFEKDQLREQFSILAAGLQELEEERNSNQQQRSEEEEKKVNENFRRFGIASWAHARKEMIEHLRLKYDPQQSDTYEILQIRETMLQEQMEHRKDQVRGYKNGLLWSVQNLLYKNDAFWRSLVEDDSDQFAKQLDVVGTRLERPLTLLQNLYPYGAEFKNQVLDELGAEMISTEKEATEWKRLYYDCYARFCTHTLKGTNIDKTFRKVMEEDVELGSFLTALILDHREGLSLLADETELREQLKACKARAKVNGEMLDAFMQKKELSPIEQVGFRMYLQDKIPFQEAGNFEQGLEQWMQEFKELSEENEKETDWTQRVMSERATMMLDVETHRENGRMADQKTRAMLRYAPTKMRGTGSPVLASLKVSVKPDFKQIEAARKKVGEYGDLSGGVQDCLLEFILSGKIGVEKELAWLKRTDAMVAQLGLEEQGAADLLTYLYTRYRGKDLTQDQVQYGYESLLNRRKSLYKLSDQSLGREEERKTVQEALAAGVYLLNEEQFHPLAEGQLAYFEAAALADNLFAEEMEKYSDQYQTPQERQAIHVALEEYFHEDILKGQKYFEEHRGSIAQQTRKMLSDPFYAAHLLSGGRMESVGNDTLTGQEKKLHTMESRETFEQFLGEKKNEAFRKKYNELDRRQRQVFALCVLQTGSINELPSAQRVRSDELQRSIQTNAQNDLNNYMSRQEFNPEISYNRVMDELCKADGSIDGGLFDAAMKQTRDCIRQHQNNRVKDYERLSDGAQSIREASRLAGEKDARQTAQPVFDLKAMKQWILEQDEKQGAKQKERLKQMDDYQMQLLGTVLQDRTILDYTTRELGKGERAEFVNEEKRAAMDRQIRGNGPERLYTANLTRAMNTLLSYQLRDDVELGHRRLSKEDFAPKALERKTQVDWALLQRAIEFVDQTQKTTG